MAENKIMATYITKQEEEEGKSDMKGTLKVPRGVHGQSVRIPGVEAMNAEAHTCYGFYFVFVKISETTSCIVPLL